MLGRAELMRAIDVATQRLLRTVEWFSDHDVERPSSLPGWSRGHVLTHVAHKCGCDAKPVGVGGYERACPSRCAALSTGICAPTEAPKEYANVHKRETTRSLASAKDAQRRELT